MSSLESAKCKFLGFCMISAIVVVTVVKSGLLGGRLTMFNNSSMSKSSHAPNQIYESDWIINFPHLSQAIKQGLGKKGSHLTCAKTSRLELVEAVEWKKGDTLRATITAYDELGNRKSYGGDFFFVTLRRPRSAHDGLTCELEDREDGTYSVECILPWSGKAALNALLVHPSESVFQMMQKFSTEKHLGLTLYTRMRNSANKTEESVCTIGFPEKSPTEVCDYSNPTHGEKRTCLKPPSGECSEIVWQSVGEDAKLLQMRDDCYFREGYNFHVPIRGSNVQITVIDDGRRGVVFPERLVSKTSVDPMTPTGWFYDNVWNPIRTKRRKAFTEACLQDKRLFFVGDSTMRMIYQDVLRSLSLTDTGKDNTVEWSQGRDAEDKKRNMTMHYRSHGPPLLNPGGEESRPYISDTLDAIISGGKGTVVFITLGYHFHVLTPDVYLNRLLIIRNVVLDMMRRLPGTQLIIKGLHYHARDIRERLWLTYRFEVLLRLVFANMPDVTYVELWDNTLLYNNTALHPSGSALSDMVNSVMSPVC